MTVKRTIKLKLSLPVGDILPTVEEYTRAFNLVARRAFEDGDFNSISVHHKVYKVLRKTLPAQLSISARMKAMESMLSMRTNRKKKKLPLVQPRSKQCSIRYDNNSMTIFLDRGEVSLLTIDGRMKAAFILPECFRKYSHWRQKSAELIIKGDTIFLHLVVENDFPDPPKNGRVVGIDRGIKHIAVTSDGEFFDSKHLNTVRRRHARLRSSLQSAGTRSAKRHLAKLRGKANRFCRDENHKISKRIVAGLQEGDVIVLENLTGIRESGNKFRKRERAQMNRWPYFQLEEFIRYKAAPKVVAVESVSPRHTSQRCSGCCKILKSNRKGQGFYSCSCGLHLNADLNAARNIANKFAEANGFRGGLPSTSPTSDSSVNAPPRG